jgi:capsule biosynthesis phosphatase
MNIIIPIGGLGQRFKDEGYLMPKPLISVLGKTMIYRVIDNLKLNDEDTIYIVYNSQLKEFNFENLVRFYFPKKNIKFISLDHVTKGASETILYGLNEMPVKELEKEFLILDCDTFYEEDILDYYRKSDNKNMIFYFEDKQTNPIFSYIKLDPSNWVTKIAEKIKISDFANTGAYGFHTGRTLKQYIEKLSGISTETYTSYIYQEMLKDNLVIKGQQVSKFSCVGTPLQLQIYCNKNKHNSEPLRICFDFDNTLVSYPTIPGDYYSVEPIQRNINFLKLLHSLGHTIIIYTARRMKTHGGNVGRVVADISRVTLDTLDKFDIPYDEIYFGKPYANFYIDDLAVNPSISMNQAIGVYDTEIAPRTFNKVDYNKDKVIKTTSNMGEVYWYQNIPKKCEYMFPKVYDITGNRIIMENIEGVSFSYLYINKLLKVEQLTSLMTQLQILHDHQTEVKEYPKVYADYVQKLRDRYNNNRGLYNKYIHAESIFKKLDNLLFYYDDAIFSVIHGDPVFTNVLQTERGLKFIDMKGKIDGELTIIGDAYYDLAKVYQSILGYDFILNDIELDNIYIDEFKTKFESLFTKEGLRNLKIITASLFFTLMPLHTEDQDKFAKYFKIINTLLDECRDN